MNYTLTKESGFVTTVVIGAGHAGLAVSRCLSERLIDHVVLERGEVANSWRKERWDSLRLLTPNWQNDLPGYPYPGNDPDGFMELPEIVSFISHYAELVSAPVITHTTVTSVTRYSTGYRILTKRGEWRCSTLVIASGACNVASILRLADQLPPNVQSLTPLTYRRPEQLAPGGVLIVGASATGLQFAEEIQRSGRPVTLSVGEHVRLPRLYRERDIHWWMDRAGVLDQRIEDQDDLQRARRVPSPQLIGSPERRTLDLNVLQAAGIGIVGRLAGLRDESALFSGSLRNCCAMADLKLDRLLKMLDIWATHADLDGTVGQSERPSPTKVPERPRLKLDLTGGNLSTVIWATGYRPDYRWLQLPVLDRKGALLHDQGVVGGLDSDTPGLYVMGLSFMRRRKSGFIYGARNDAYDITALLKNYLDKIHRHHPRTCHGSKAVTTTTTNADVPQSGFSC